MCCARNWELNNPPSTASGIMHYTASQWRSTAQHKKRDTRRVSRNSFINCLRSSKLSFICAETYQKCVIPRERSDRGNLIELRTGVSYGCRIWFAQYIEIATPPSAVRNDTCGANRCYTAKLSFNSSMMYHALVPLVLRGMSFCVAK